MQTYSFKMAGKQQLSENLSPVAVTTNGKANNDSKLATLQQLLIDVVLPRHIPYEKDTSHFGQELQMLCRMREAVHGLATYLPDETVRMFETFERVHLANSADVTAEEIDQLQPGSTFAMFVRRQNLGFMCYRPKDGAESVIVSTFHTRLAAGQVYSYPLDVEVSFGEFRDFFSFGQLSVTYLNYVFFGAY